MDMNRRTLLACLGSSTVGLAGCLGFEPPRGEFRLGSTDGPERCPSVDDDVQRVVCTDSTVPSDESVYVTRSVARADLPTASLSFTLHNDSTRQFMTNFYSWHVWKYVGSRWHYVAPRGWPVPGMTVPPGESHTWRVRVDNTKFGGTAIERPEGTESVELVGLGGGQYAFSTDGWFEGAGHEQKVGVATLFALDGPALELRPMNDVENVDPDGETVTVRTEREQGDGSRIAAFELTRTGEPTGEVHPLVVEQAVRDERLRKTLPYFEPDVERVRLIEPNGDYPPFHVHEPVAIAYEGETYQMEAEVLQEG